MQQNDHFQRIIFDGLRQPLEEQLWRTEGDKRSHYQGSRVNYKHKGTKQESPPNLEGKEEGMCSKKLHVSGMIGTETTLVSKGNELAERKSENHDESRFVGLISPTLSSANPPISAVASCDSPNRGDMR